MDPYAPRCKLRPVGDEVVELPRNLQGVGVQKRQILFARHGEHMVHWLYAFLVLVPLEEREVCHPAQREHLPVGEPKPIPEMEP